MLNLQTKYAGAPGAPGAPSALSAIRRKCVVAGLSLRLSLGLMLGFVGAAQALEEVPFITSPDQVTLAMLKLAQVRERDFVLDLGSGDGRIVITAAKRFDARGLGVEIDPSLVRRSQENALKAGVAKRAQFIEQDLFKTDLAQASVITLYLLPDVNLQLRAALLKLKPGTRIVSHDWDMGDWVPDRSVQVDVPDKAVGRDKFSRVHLWTVPADLQGTWCAWRGRVTAQLVMSQRYQMVSAKLRVGAVEEKLDGRIQGRELHLGQGPTSTRWVLDTARESRLKLEAVRGDLAVWRPFRFERAAGATCAPA